MAKIGQFMVSPRLQNDWADAHSTIFEKPMYIPMRRPEGPSAYAEGARAFRLDGLDTIRFDRDREPGGRPPI